MKTIWKYELKGDSPFTVDLPEDALIATFAVINNRFFIWMEVDPKQPTESRQFRVVGTGWEWPDEWLYMGTCFRDDPFVWHLIENRGEF